MFGVMILVGLAVGFFLFLAFAPNAMKQIALLTAWIAIALSVVGGIFNDLFLRG